MNNFSLFPERCQGSCHTGELQKLRAEEEEGCLSPLPILGSCKIPASFLLLRLLLPVCLGFFSNTLSQPLSQAHVCINLFTFTSSLYTLLTKLKLPLAVMFNACVCTTCHWLPDFVIGHSFTAFTTSQAPLTHKKLFLCLPLL